MPPSDTSQLSQVKPEPLGTGDVPSLPHSNSTITLRRILTGLTRVQKYSAYIFGTFLGIHVTSVVVVPCLPSMIVPLTIKQEIFEMARAVYHSIPMFETAVILASSITHVIAGISIRAVRWRINRHRPITRQKSHDAPVNEKSDDVGLGGITSLIGLGYRKSIISKLVPGLTPLSFSGYCLFPLLGYHFYKFRYLPYSIDGDSSLINLEYISYYLNVSPQAWGNLFNFVSIASLVWVTAYHVTSGWLKFNNKYSSKWKKFGYLVINVTSLLGIISIFKFKNDFVNLDHVGFIGKSFTNYLASALV